ncbi:MAG: NB-ARC domain-containing protein [Thermosynechococcaceae cyanobacterium]
MNLEESISYINQLASEKRGKALIEPERLIIKGAWEDIDYEEIATNSKFSRAYLQNKLAPQLWRFLEGVLGIPISKKKLRDYFEELSSIEGYSAALLKIPGFIGRYELLQELDEKIPNSKCVGIYGVGGIGKTALLSAWISKSLSTKICWEKVVWSSSYSSSIRDSLSSVLESIGYKVEAPENLLRDFLREITERKLLIVIDSIELIYSAKYGSEAWTENRKILRTIIEAKHQSCIILIGREILSELQIHSKNSSIELIKVGGLSVEESRILFEEYELKDQEHWNALIERYRGVPLALHSVAQYIEKNFDKSVAKYTEFQTLFVGSEVENLIKEQCLELNESQRKLLAIFASINQDEKYLRIKQIQKKWTGSGLLDSIKILEEKSLIEPSDKESMAWTVQPVIIKFIRKTPELFSNQELI